jgi:hypothetical protein
MYRFLVIFLFSAFVWGQAPTHPASSLNSSENAQKARTVIDQAITALGGQAYLTYENKAEQGRYYPLHHGRSDTTGIPYNYFTKYPDKDRFEVLGVKDVHVIPGTIDIGGVKAKKPAIILIHNGQKGYETTYKGTAPQDPEELARYLRRRPHSIEWVFRKWINDPGVALFDDGMTVVEGKTAEQISLLNNQNDAVTIFIDQNSHLPVKVSYSWRDPADKQRNTEEEVYDNYKPVQGILSPHSVTRFYNGDMTQQRFITTIKYNLKLPDSEFEATVNYDPRTYDPKHPPGKR